MKMICQLTFVLVGLLWFQSTVVDAETQEFLQMKIFDRNFRVSESEMHAMLKKANLTGHGYKKEVTMKQRQNADNSKLEYEKAYFFYKVVNCTQISTVEQELDNLLPGVLGKDAENAFKKEVKFRHLNNMGMCRVGMEIHFMESEGCTAADKKVSRQRKKRFLDCLFCRGCKVVQSNKAPALGHKAPAFNHKAPALNHKATLSPQTIQSNQTTLSTT